MGFVILSLTTQCSEEEVIPQQETVTSLSVEKAAVTAATAPDCSTCTYIVKPGVQVDGEKLGLKPGSVICLDAALKYTNIRIINLKGTATNPIKIMNCGGGTATVDGTGKNYAIRTEKCQYFKISGQGPGYGIKVVGGQMGITLDVLSSDFEIDHVEVMNSGFAGMMAKTDPNCDNATIRGNFIMKNVSFHDNYIHDTGGEGFYIGNTSFQNGVTASCGKRMPHEIHSVKIYNNIVKNTGWDGIQLSAATVGAEIYNNTVENYATVNKANQNSGIVIGEGTGGKCYNNIIKGGTGNGMAVLGLGDNVVYNNVIANAGAIGIFCDERHTTGSGFKFLHNTIINPKHEGIKLYADLVAMNAVINNIIVNPGNYDVYEKDSSPRTGNDAYLFLLNNKVKVTAEGNYFTRNINDLKFVNASAFNFQLTSGSPVINKGVNISSYNITTDILNTARLKGAAYDAGAYEY